MLDFKDISATANKATSMLSEDFDKFLANLYPMVNQDSGNISLLIRLTIVYFVYGLKYILIIGLTGLKYYLIYLGYKLVIAG